MDRLIRYIKTLIVCVTGGLAGRVLYYYNEYRKFPALYQEPYPSFWERIRFTVFCSLGVITVSIIICIILSVINNKKTQQIDSEQGK